ncbi:MAG: hypothetical protein KDA28_11880, partial [Phycisphaerales bacterium]|nr:hypothetical protein [Phycisphaerales bacterium]
MLNASILARLVLACVATTTLAEDIRSFLEIRAPRSVSVGPEGRVYAIDWPDGVNQLYMREPGETSWNRLTDFTDGVSSYDLSPDGGHLVVEASAGGSEQNDLHLVETASGRMRTLRADPEVVFGFQCWLRDGSGFIYRANDEVATDFHLYRHDLETGTSTRILGEEG